MAHKRFTRREFLRTLAVAGASGAAFSLASCSKAEREQFFQKHFLEMTDAEKKQTVKRLEEGYLEKYGLTFSRERSRGHAPHPVGVRPRPFALYRVQAMRLCLCEGEQPVAA